LNNSGSPVGGSYDLTFTIYDSTNIPGNVIAGPITNSATLVSNGLFTTTLDFGSNVFNGNAAWLEIGVRTNGNAAFATLSPRQQLTPTPYALFANTASNLSGTVSASQLSGTIPSAQLPSSIITNGASGINLSGTFTGSLNGNTTTTALASNVVSGIAITNAFITNSIFGGNGSGLTNLNAAKLIGSVPTNSLTSVPAGNLFGTIYQANLGTSGSYLPTIGDGVNNFTGGFDTSGYYLKMGSLVYFEVFVSWSSKGSANSGSIVQISLPPGLPVASQYTVPNFTIGEVGGIAFGNLLTAVSPGGATYFELLSSYSAASPQILTVATFSAGGELSVSGFYRWQ
jgi:hypothetical protein